MRLKLIEVHISYIDLEESINDSENIRMEFYEQNGCRQGKTTWCMFIIPNTHTDSVKMLQIGKTAEQTSVLVSKHIRL